MNNYSRQFVTLFGLGYFPTAPGTIASLVGIVAGGLIIIFPYGHYVLALLIVLFWWLGTKCLTSLFESFDSKDPSEVVIDEVVGQWIALWPLMVIKVLWIIGYWELEFVLVLFIPSLAALFFLFRFFDITKPSLIGWIDKQGTPNSIILDDVLAGFFAGLVFFTLIFLGFFLSL